MTFNCIAFLYKLNVPFLNASLSLLWRHRLSPQADSLLSFCLYPCSLPTAARISILNVSMKMSLLDMPMKPFCSFNEIQAYTRWLSCFDSDFPSPYLRLFFPLEQGWPPAAPDHDRAVLHHRHEHCSSSAFITR